jgi:hypothetical protein
LGWYEQRIAVENDAEAVAIMRDAQGEEFKHFSMDLEFLLRRTPAWREVAQGILFQTGDIVEHGEEAEAEAFEGGAPVAQGGYEDAAVERLLCSGITGPYGLALGREQYRRVVETAEHGGYPLLDHLRKILEGPIVWAPGVEGAIVLSLRGGDFLFESGQDLSIGYESHDAEVVRLYLEESFSFHVATPEAAVALQP